MFVLSTSRSAYEGATRCTIMSHTAVSHFWSVTVQLLKAAEGCEALVVSLC